MPDPEAQRCPTPTIEPSRPAAIDLTDSEISSTTPTVPSLLLANDKLPLDSTDGKRCSRRNKGGTMTAMGDDESPLAAAAARVGDRWSLLVVEALLAGPGRFNDLLEAVTGIAPNILSQRLKHLEREGVLTARPYSRRPPRLSYELTAGGRELAGALHLLAAWGAQQAGISETTRHEACGTPLQHALWCPTCARVVDEPAEPGLRFL
jgi:DNA-binding HxlR family transcriptional regulator